MALWISRDFYATAPIFSLPVLLLLCNLRAYSSHSDNLIHAVNRRTMKRAWRVLHKEIGMEFTCRRCNHLIKRKFYRLITEEAGVVLLNMVVCSSCARLAKRLGLAAREIESAKSTAKTKDRLRADRRQTAEPRPSVP